MPATKRELTILFCDLRGSTSMAEQLPLADFMDLIKTYHNFVSQAVVIQYGYVVQFLGDGIMAYFGYPTAYAGAPAKAVAAGLDIANTIIDLKSEVLTRFNLKLSIRVSVHTGTVVMADLGVGNRRETLALGEAPNIAARLQSYAPENSVVVTESTYQQCKDLFDFKFLGNMSLKGITGEIPVYQPIAVLS